METAKKKNNIASTLSSESAPTTNTAPTGTKTQKINHAKPLLYGKATWVDLDLTDARDTVIKMGDLFVLT